MIYYVVYGNQGEPIARVSFAALDDAIAFLRQQVVRGVISTLIPVAVSDAKCTTN